MSGVTQTIITAALAGDNTITKEQADAVIAILTGEKRTGADRIIPLADVRKRIGKSRFTVCRWCKCGKLKGFITSKRLTGVYESSLINLGL